MLKKQFELFNKLSKGETWTIESKDTLPGTFQNFVRTNQDKLDRCPLARFRVKDFKSLPLDESLCEQTMTNVYKKTYEGHREDAFINLSEEKLDEKVIVNDFLKMETVKKVKKPKKKQFDPDFEPDLPVKKRKKRTPKEEMKDAMKDVKNEEVFEDLEYKAFTKAVQFFAEERNQYTFHYVFDLEQSLINLKDQNIFWDLPLECGIKANLPGISTLWGSLGKLYTLSSFHFEDANLRSLNWHAWGAAKIWFSIHPNDMEAFLKLVDEKCTKETDLCRSFYRHKCHFLHPSFLMENEIQVIYQIQHPGDFIMTSGPHWIINLGVNYNVALNFFIENDIHEFRRFGPKFGRYCDKKCQYTEQCYLYQSLGFEGWSVKCLFCEKRHCFSDRGIKWHVTQVHKKEGDDNKNYPMCDYCNQQTINSHHHWMIQHKDLWIDMEYRCYKCREVFISHKELGKHIRESNHLQIKDD